MITVAIVKRRLKEGKTYEDFRKAWFHTVGFGTPADLYTMINVADPREIIVVGFVKSDLGKFPEGLNVDVSERLAHSLDDVIEPEIDRTFGVLVSEDDFSTEGAIGYQPPAIDGITTDMNEISHVITEIARMIGEASAKRDIARAALKHPGNAD
jgi:hypothetical protein